MNCDGDLDGKVIGTVERLGVAIAYVKDRRALTRPVATDGADVAHELKMAERWPEVAAVRLPRKRLLAEPGASARSHD